MQLILNISIKKQIIAKIKEKRKQIKLKRNNHTGIEVFCKQWNKLPFAQISITTANLVSRVAP